jgi:glycosyltransferase involved in cell wall biosynthesis
MTTPDSIRMLVMARDTFPPFRVDVAVLFGQELAARGFAIDWILQAEKAGNQEFECQWGSGSVWVGRTDCGCSWPHRLRKHYLDLLHDLKVFRLSRRFNYDILQVKDKVLAALPALWCAHRSGSVFVYWLSFPYPEASIYNARINAARYPLLYRVRGWFMFQLLYRFILPRADHVFVQSEQMKSDLASYGLSASKMTAVPMGVELKDFDAISVPDSTQAPPAPTIAYLGTLASSRRIDFLVRCLALVLRERPNARLLLVGAGNQPMDEDQIRSEARRLGILDRVEITGFLDRKDALQLISRATVCVSPFYPTPILNSTSPTKLIEYMAIGRPVVANDHPEQRLVLQQSRAGYCVPYEERAFAGAILRVLADPIEAMAMGRRGREYVERHRDYRRIGEFVAQQYREIVLRSASRVVAHARAAGESSNGQR